MNMVFCHQCMRKRSPDEVLCPVCGYEHGKNDVQMHALSPETILDGRFLLGNMQKQDQNCIYYSALDLQKDTVVRIKEYYPHGKTSRTGLTVAWSVSLDEVQKLLIEFQNQNKDSDLFLENGTIYCAEKMPAAEQKKPVKAEIVSVSVPVKQSNAITKANTTAVSKKTVRQKNTGKIKKNSCFGMVAAIVCVIVLILGWCGINHIRGNQAMEQERYADAIAAYKMDFLFSSKACAEAISMAGEEAFTSGDYAAAAEYFGELGADGETRRSDAIYEQAKQLIKEEKYEDAILILESIKSEERASALTGVAQLEIAKELYRDGKTEEAIKQAESVENTTQADVVAFLNLIYLNEANIRIGREDYKGAVSFYKKCQGDAEAEFNLSVLETLMNGNPYQAATVIAEQLDGSASSISRWEWQVIFENVISDLPEAKDLDVCLSRETAIALLKDPIDFNDESHAESFDIFLKGNYMIGATEIEGDRCFSVSSMEDLYSQCGTAPAGKILIVLQTHDFPDKNKAQMVSLGVMNLLPVEYRPVSLAEVEYIVLVSYNYSKTGKYTKGTTAVQENAKITVYRMPDKKSVANSGTLRGDRAPNSFYYYVTPPDWYSGGAPNVSSKLVGLLKKIM